MNSWSKPTALTFGSDIYHEAKRLYPKLPEVTEPRNGAVCRTISAGVSSTECGHATNGGHPVVLSENPFSNHHNLGRFDFNGKPGDATCLWIWQR